MIGLLTAGLKQTKIIDYTGLKQKVDDERILHRAGGNLVANIYLEV
jgi:hypothetical protein